MLRRRFLGGALAAVAGGAPVFGQAGSLPALRYGPPGPMPGAPRLARAQSLDLQTRADALLEACGAPAVGIGMDIGFGPRMAVAGLRARGQPDQVTPLDLWHTGSNTKSMLATVAARLVEQGQIDWRTPLRSVLGTGADLHSAYGDVTLEDCLRHLGGLPQNAGPLLRRALRPGGPPELRRQRRRLSKALLSRAPDVAPGTFQYSNAGYVVAAAMLEEVTDTAWETLMHQQLFTPLGIESAGYGAPGTKRRATQPYGHSAGWFRKGHAVPPGPDADNPAAEGPAGNVHLSLADHLTYLNAHLHRDPGYLSPQSWARLHTPSPGTDYAAGWGVLPDGSLIHAGSNTLWFHLVLVSREANASLVLATNDGDIDRVEPHLDRALSELVQALKEGAQSP